MIVPVFVTAEGDYSNRAGATAAGATGCPVHLLAGLLLLLRIGAQSFL